MMNAAGSLAPPSPAHGSSVCSSRFIDVDLGDLATSGCGGASSEFPSPAFELDLDGSLSRTTSHVGTVSPQDLLLSPYMSAPNSSALTALTSPSIFNESPDVGGDFEVSPDFGTSDLDCCSDQWYSLFELRNGDRGVAKGADNSPAQQPAGAVPPAQETDADSIHQSTVKSGRRKASRPSDNGRPSFSSVSGVTARRRNKPLPPIIVDPNDPVALKRARNTTAARRSRLRKAERAEELEQLVISLRAERDHWKSIALSRSDAQ